MAGANVSTTKVLVLIGLLLVLDACARSGWYRNRTKSGLLDLCLLYVEDNNISIYIAPNIKLSLDSQQLVYIKNLVYVKGSGHYWLLLKIIISIKPLLVMSNGERLMV